MYQVFLLTMILISGITHSNIIKFAEKGDLSSIQECVENGVDINSKNKHGATAFILATEAGYDTIADYLLKKGADPNLKYNHIQRNINKLFWKFKLFLWQIRIIKSISMTEIAFG